MNSERPSELLLIVVGIILLLTQMSGYRQVEGLQRQVADLRQQVTHQQPAAPAAQIASEERPAPTAVSQAPLASGLDLTATQPDETQQERIRLAQVSRQERGLQELSEDELNTVVAGELGPAPGMAAAVASGPTATLPVEAISRETETQAQRLAPRVEKGGVLLRKGRTQVEPTISYSHISKNRIGLSGLSIYDVIFIGEIRAEEVERDLFTSSVNIRHGVTNKVQVDVELPAQLQREDTFGGPIEERSQSTSYYRGLNDISTGVFYQFMNESSRRPGMIAHARVKAPLGEAPRFGSGVWAVKTGLVMVKSSDPVALFSNMAYTYTFPGQVNRVDINPGNSFEYNVGLAYALNYHLAANASFEQIFVTPALQNGAAIAGSRLVLANFKAGLTYAITKNFSVDASVGTGLTEDSPDVTVSISFPYTF